MFLLILYILLYSLIVWLAFYLLSRDPRSRTFRGAGITLGFAAIAAGLAGLQQASSMVGSGPDFSTVPSFALAYAGMGIVVGVYQLGDDSRLIAGVSHRSRLFSLTLFPLLIYILFVNRNGGTGPTIPSPDSLSGVVFFALFVLVPAAITSLLAWRLLQTLARGVGAFIVSVGVFLTVAGAMLVRAEPSWLPKDLTVISVLILTAALGLGLVILDAREKGEALLPDLFRAFDYALFTVILFGGQIVLLMVVSTGVTVPLVILLLTVIATATAVQVFLDQVQLAFDRVAFASIPGLRRSRAELREVASTLPKVSQDDPLLLDEDEFYRHTRRALSHFGDLAKLSTNPLTNLSLIDQRLADHGTPAGTIERAVELKALLVEAIEQLKPRDNGDFGTSDEWRYYNALYFPYVMGVKPYSVRAVHSMEDRASWDALDWFRTYVPERTLHNWQSAAARLVAAYLREQSELVATSERPIPVEPLPLSEAEPAHPPGASR